MGEALMPRRGGESIGTRRFSDGYSSVNQTFIFAHPDPIMESGAYLVSGFQDHLAPNLCIMAGVYANGGLLGGAVFTEFDKKIALIGATSSDKGDVVVPYSLFLWIELHTDGKVYLHYQFDFFTDDVTEYVQYRFEWCGGFYEWGGDDL